jgi:hydroxymethylpyrimidine pyrophosphatase-like HAD family hydrolase
MTPTTGPGSGGAGDGGGRSATSTATAHGRPRYRVLALDVDGTLLDSDGALRPSTAEAVARAARAGIRPVLCTGRRYRRARPVAEQLGLDAPLVCNSGAIVKDPAEHRTLWRADFDRALLLDVLAVFRDHDEPVVSFTDNPPDGHDFLVEQPATGRPLFDDYLDQNRAHAAVVPGWTARAVNGHGRGNGDGDSRADGDGPHDGPHFHLCAIGARPAMLALERAVLGRLGARVRTFVQRSPRYAGTMCEVIRHDASKWAAILHLAGLWGVSAAEVVAVGDDMNDLPMIAGAGLGVAMGHAPEPVRAAADLVTGDHDQDGVAMLVDRVLLP